MKKIVLCAGLALAASTARAQEDPVERQVERLKQFLQLSDEQTTKVRDVLKKQNEDLRTVLTDEQKQRYEQLLRSMGGGGGGRGMGGRGGNNGAWYPPTEELKTQLKLTDEQVTKIEEIRDGVRQEMRDIWRNREPGTDPQQAMEKLRTETTKRVRDALTDEQKPKFDEIMKEFGSGGDAPRPPQDRRGRPSAEERVRRVMESLKVENAEEAAALRDAVKKAVEAQNALEECDRETRQKAEELGRKADATEDEIKAKIDELRTGRREKDKAVRDAQKALAEIVTYKQELELIRFGVLR